MRLLSADFIYHPEGWLDNHVLAIDEEGRVLALRPRQRHELVERFSGYLIPGLVNAHTHLELSHLRGQIPEGIGMAGFIREVFRLRNAFSDEQQQRALEAAWQEAADAGTVAFGDICNTDLTVPIKQNNPQVLSHSFLELPGLDPSRAGRVWQHGETLRQAFLHLPHSFTAHAPYSMSLPLMEMIYSHSRHLSIHLLESEAEWTLFRTGQGPLAEAFRDFGLVWPPFPDKRPDAYVSRGIAADSRVIWVHGLQLDARGVEELTEAVPDSYFCLCPRSNYFLHREWPSLSIFAPVSQQVCLGTDSLASNHDLNVWKEVLALQQLPGAPDFHRLVSWATTNGAAALGLSNVAGKFRVGTRPGVLWARTRFTERLERIDG